MTGPLRLAAVVFVLGFLVVWLIRPIGNPCPDRGVLPKGSSKSSAPSFAPPGTRTCTYTTPEGTKARFHYVPWLDWLVLVVLTGLAAAVRLGAGDPPRERRAARQPARGPARREPRAERDRSHEEPSARDAADRERARRERLRRARHERGSE